MPRSRSTKYALLGPRSALFGISALLIASLLGIWKLRTRSHTLAGDENIGVVKRMDLVQDVTVSGTIIPNKKTIFAPPYAAYIRRIYVKLGAQVKAGDPVLSLEQSLHSTHEEVFPLRAPFEGLVVQVLHNEGEYVDVGKDNSPIIRIDDISRLFITASIPETDVEKVKTGQKVVIKATPVTSKVYHGIIREIFGAATEKTQGVTRPGDRVEFQIKIEIEDADELLRPGMSAIVDVITEKKHGVLALPHEYVEKEKDEYFVTLVDGKRKNIKVGMQNDHMFEIESGVDEGDRVRMVDFASLPQEG